MKHTHKTEFILRSPYFICSMFLTSSLSQDVGEDCQQPRFLSMFLLSLW